MTYGPFTLASYPCPLCGADSSRVVGRKPGRVVPKAFTIVACTSCGHIRVDPRIADERLDDLYDEAYYRGDGFDATIDYSAPPTAETTGDNTDIADSIADAVGGSLRGLRWLDVGCGTGALMEEARDRGAIVSGFDSSRFARENCMAKGLHLLDEAEIELADSAFDIVSAVEVIEHVPDPLGFLAYLKARARPGGVVFVRTGNWNLVRRLPGTPYLMPEGHIQYFTPVAMRRMFRRLSLRESPAFNRTWFVWRLCPRPLRNRIPARAFSMVATLARRLAAGHAPFPIGIR